MTILGMLLAYDASGNIIATLDHRVQLDDDGNALGLIDFAAHEAAGGEHADIWHVEQTNTAADGTVTTTPAKGSKVWPEWLGERAHDFRVELDGPSGAKRISALVHKASGHRRERAAIEAAIQARIDAAGNGPADIRDLVGGPDRPLHVDPEGKTLSKPVLTRPNLPLVRNA